jgi:hypothetical protein
MPRSGLVQQSDALNPHTCGTFITHPAHAGCGPKASRDRSLGTLGNKMNTSPLRVLRWSLIIVLAALLVYICYTGVTGFFSMAAKAEFSFTSVAGIVLFSGFFAWMALIPTIMLFSLITRRLNGFASCIGMAVSLLAFYGAMVIPNQIGLMNWWWSITAIPDAIKVLFGFVIPIALLIFPFWLLFRLMRLTNEWLYPKILKPLETKI